jgi:hypothetical protein
MGVSAGDAGLRNSRSPEAFRQLREVTQIALWVVRSMILAPSGYGRDGGVAGQGKGAQGASDSLREAINQRRSVLPKSKGNACIMPLVEREQYSRDQLLRRNSP